MPALLVYNDDKWVRYDLLEGETLIGRHPDCHIQLSASVVSTRHARLTKDGDTFWLEDLASRNGTTLNGLPVDGRVRVDNNDTIQFSHDIIARFRDEESDVIVSAEDQPIIKEWISSDSQASRLGRSSEAKLKALLQITQVLAGTLDVEALLPKVLDGLFHIFPPAERGCILLVDEQSGEMIPRCARTRHEDGMDTVRVSRTIINRVLHERNGVLSEDAGSDFDAALSVTDLAIRSVMCVPILEFTGEPIGVINLDSKSRYAHFTSEDLDVLMIVAGQIAFSLQYARILEKLLDEHRQRFDVQRQRDELGKYFSPQVVQRLHDSVSEDDSVSAENLNPRVVDISVLFCDIRGFSRRAERAPHKLQEILDRCREALQVMTHHILENGGNISDFQGDAALGYWGWPIVLSEGPLPACRAALAIHREFAEAQRDENHPLYDFHIGIGIAHGPAIAGKIGSKVLAKIGVFGPPVNLGARLESMTKELRVPILICERTAEFVAETMQASEGRCRPMAKILPYGLDNPLKVFQLLPSVEADPTVSNEHTTLYETALVAFNEGLWSEAIDLLAQLPVEDRAQDLLLQTMLFHGHEPPEDWDGIVRMTRK
jgi:adenylate cyclase